MPLIAEVFAEFAAALTPGKIPAVVRERAKYLMLDATGIALASTKTEFAASALAGLSSWGTGNSVVIGMDSRLSLRDAVTMNGILVHGLDYDDTHTESVMHVSAGCFPCALNVAAERGAPGADMLTSYILGIEVGSRLGIAANGRFHEVGCTPSGLLVAFSGALIAGWMHKLNVEELVMAQGIALSTTSASSRQYNREGAWTKRLHPGWCAAGGIVAAALAMNGFVGPRECYEGDYGLYALHLMGLKEKCDLSLATAGLGQIWETNKVAIKPMPACHLAHACSDAATALAKMHHINGPDVASVQAFVPADAVRVICEPVKTRRRPVTSYAAQFSLPYIVACSLMRGRFGFNELERDAYTDPDILSLADKVEYVIDPTFDYPRYFSGGVKVTMRDGREYSHRELVNRGSADRPLSAGDIVFKFMENAARAITKNRAKKIMDAVLSIDECKDVGKFAEMLSVK